MGPLFMPTIQVFKSRAAVSWKCLNDCSDCAAGDRMEPEYHPAFSIRKNSENRDCSESTGLPPEDIYRTVRV
jgi:hypothetical protein